MKIYKWHYYIKLQPMFCEIQIHTVWFSILWNWKYFNYNNNLKANECKICNIFIACINMVLSFLLKITKRITSALIASFQIFLTWHFLQFLAVKLVCPFSSKPLQAISSPETDYFCRHKINCKNYNKIEKCKIIKRRMRKSEQSRARNANCFLNEKREK